MDASDLPSVSRLVTEVRLRSPHARYEPRIDIEAVASDVGATVTWRAGTGELGHAARDDSGYAIFASPRDARARVRFTLAHEIGHVLFDQLGVPLVSQVCNDEVERRCNEFAASVLMPTTWIRKRAQARADLSVVRTVAADAQTSTSAAFTAVARAMSWQATFVRLRWDAMDVRWRPVELKTRGFLPLDPSVSLATSDALGPPSSAMATMSLPLEFAGQELFVPCDVLRGAEFVTFVADLAPLRRVLRAMAAALTDQRN